MKELLKDQLLRPRRWSVAVLITLGIFIGAYVANGGHMFSPGELSEKARIKIPLGGVASHAELANNCAACHASPLGGQTMADRCLDCHTNVRSQLDSHGPMHGRIPENAQQCRTCHTEHRGAHANLTSLASFNHDWTAFKLTGGHTQVKCQSCHAGEVFQGSPQSCVSCHAEPVVHKGRFGNNCVECHTTSTWVLTVGSGKSLANFDHDSTGFKLTGKHASTDCRKCHLNDTFKGTAKSCVSCHADPIVHKGRFGTACADCHSTSSWTGAVFKHTIFPVNHRSTKNTCATCHNDQTNFHSYTCYNCHEHAPAKEEKRHARRKIADASNCIKCHGRDKKQRTMAAPAHDACPELVAGFGSFTGCPAGSAAQRGADSGLLLLAALTPAPRKAPSKGWEAPAEPELARKITFTQGSGSVGASLSQPRHLGMLEPLARIFLPGSSRWDMMK